MPHAHLPVCFQFRGTAFSFGCAVCIFWPKIWNSLPPHILIFQTLFIYFQPAYPACSARPLCAMILMPNFAGTTVHLLLTSGDGPSHVDTRGWRYSLWYLHVNDDDDDSCNECLAVFVLMQSVQLQSHCSHAAVWLTLLGAAARMADSTTLLSICDPVHLVLIKTTRSGDTSLVSSHFLDWRQVLAAADSRCRINVELMGIGQYQLKHLIITPSFSTLSIHFLWLAEHRVCVISA